MFEPLIHAKSFTAQSSSSFDIWVASLHKILTLTADEFSFLQKYIDLRSLVIEIKDNKYNLRS